MDHAEDDGLLKIEEELSEAMCDVNPRDTVGRIRVLARVVCERFGGSYEDEATLNHFWEVASAAEKKRSRWGPVGRDLM